MKIFSIMLQILELLANTGLLMFGIFFLHNTLKQSYIDAKGLFKSRNKGEKDE